MLFKYRSINSISCFSFYPQLFELAYSYFPVHNTNQTWQIAYSPSNPLSKTNLLSSSLLIPYHSYSLFLGVFLKLIWGYNMHLVIFSPPNPLSKTSLKSTLLSSSLLNTHPFLFVLSLLGVYFSGFYKPNLRICICIHIHIQKYHFIYVVYIYSIDEVIFL